MRRLLVCLGAVCLLGAVTHCGTDTEDGATTATGSCTTSINDAAALCVGYIDLGEAVVTAAKTACSGSGMAWSDSACATTDSVGSCANTNSDGTKYSQTYYSGTYDAETAETSCTGSDSGVFTAAS